LKERAAMTAATPAKHGTGHFIAERVTAIVLLVLMPWFFFSIALSMDGSYESAAAWAASPINAVGLALFLVVTFYHMRLGLQVVIEDYIHKSGTRGMLLALNSIVTLGAGLAGLWAIYKISFGG
jgi:succinate dehydrogenase / fumarate reductase membrane anchor subunit